MKREQDNFKKTRNGSIDRVKNYGNSSTFTLREHLRLDHGILCSTTVENSEGSTCVKGPKQAKLSFEKNVSKLFPAATEFEMNRDFAVWACLDLLPFSFIESVGTKYYFGKNFPNVSLPSRFTLQRAGIYDVYDLIMARLKEDLKEVQLTGSAALCVMFDSWTDKHKRFPYVGLRIGYINNNWEHKVITVSLKVLDKHTADALSSHVRREMESLDVDLLKVILFTVHDGAPNMVKTSQLLKSSNFQHCIAHALHLLLMNDGINKIDDIVELIDRCKAAIGRLTFKSCLLMDEAAKVKDVDTWKELSDMLSRVNEVLDADSAITIGLTETNAEPEHASNEPRPRQHQTLKQPNVTRWNSILPMIESMLTMWRELNEALKRNGDRDYCLSDEDKASLVELKNFLTPFKELTDLVSSEHPHLGFIILIVNEIRDACAINESDSESLQLLKQAIQINIDRRISISDAAKIAGILDPSLKKVARACSTDDELKTLLQQKTLHAVQRRHLQPRAEIHQPQGATAATMSVTTTRGNGGSNKNSMPSQATPATGEHEEMGQDQSQITGASADKAAKVSKKQQLVNKFQLTSFDANLTGKIEAEVASYLTFEMPVDEDPLKFWKTHENIFPLLSILAKCYLTCSAASVPVEEMFSITGLMLNQRRSSMAPSRANIVSFIHDNFAKFFSVSKSE